MRPLTTIPRYIPVLLLFFLATPQTHPTLKTLLSPLLSRTPPHHRLRRPSQIPDHDLGPLPLSHLHPSLLQTSLLLRPGASLQAAPRPLPNTLCTSRTPCTLLVELWYNPALLSLHKPDPLLSAYLLPPSVPTPLPRVRPSAASRRVTRNNLPNLQSQQLADREAFRVWRPYHYLQLPNVTTTSDWVVRVRNYNGTVRNTLNATLRLTLSLPSQKPKPNIPAPMLCPRGPGNRACSGAGACRRGVCQCRAAFGGRYCENAVRNFTTNVFSVAPERMAYFRYVAPRNGSVAVVLYLHADGGVNPTAQGVLFAKRLYENGGNAPGQGPPLPSIYDMRFADKAGVRRGLSVQKVVRTGLVKGEALYIGVYNLQKYPPLWFQRRRSRIADAGLLSLHRSIHVRLQAFPCVERRLGQYEDVAVDELIAQKKLRFCPPRSGQEQWEIGITFLLLPFLLVTLTLLTVVVCVSVWASVFRRQIFQVIHGHAPEEGGAATSGTRRDKLSEAEVNAMFPAFVFTKGETAALGATGDVCCSVCLCSFEEGDLLRRLACGHSYHSSCLDQWLITNATCPRCRKSARINGEAARSSWFSRQGLSRMFSRVGNRVLAMRQMRGRDTERFESVEVEGFLSESEFSRQLGPGS